jgi:hypothetical protein
MEGLRYRLDLLEPAVNSLDVFAGSSSSQYSTIVVGSDQLDPEGEVICDQIASGFFGRLTDRQRNILALRLSSTRATLNQIGSIVGLSKSTVQNELSGIADLLSDMDVSQKDAERVLALLSELCAQHLEQTNWLENEGGNQNEEGKADG